MRNQNLGPTSLSSHSCSRRLRPGEGTFLQSFTKYVSMAYQWRQLRVHTFSLHPSSRVGVEVGWEKLDPNLQDQMPDDLRWSWWYNNWNKMHNKCNVLGSSWNHPPPPVCENCLPRNQSPVPKRLGTTVLEYSTLSHVSFIPEGPMLVWLTHLEGTENNLYLFLITYKAN